MSAKLTQYHEKVSPSTVDALLDPWASSLKRCAAANRSSCVKNFALLGVWGRKKSVRTPNTTVMICKGQYWAGDGAASTWNMKY